ncbi:hypothetical protein [Shinella kummerowiae]|uniref:hypothetical protein n=1 Tax=Shinella kummerowiae TaxID=417745 RepID=UPI0021B65927|nr:hypothetical protein [Shinella kummerowiae]MCT7662337.1 hypothetical protein [Shinella kummerowiae]
MFRFLELVVAGAIGAAMPTAAAIYFAQTPEVYLTTPELTMCGSSSDPCHITLSDAVSVSLDGEVPVTLSAPVDMNLGCGGGINQPCAVELKQRLVDPFTIRIQQ